MIKFAHFNFNVLDLERSLKFYKEALGLEVVRRFGNEEFTIVYLSDHTTEFQLELTWMHERKGAYNLGECEYHLAFITDDYDNLHQKHQEMGCICFENAAMGIYFIEDPDGYWLEVLPQR